LIGCPECASQISGRAAACPRCGVPMSHQALAQNASPWAINRAVTIQATGKTYKALQLAGGAVTASAVASCAAGVPGSGSWSGLLFLMGAMLYIGGRVAAWWNHG
jgi:hypothetical protein